MVKDVVYAMVDNMKAIDKRYAEYFDVDWPN